MNGRKYKAVPVAIYMHLRVIYFVLDCIYSGLLPQMNFIAVHIPITADANYNAISGMMSFSLHRTHPYFP